MEAARSDEPESWILTTQGGRSLLSEVARVRLPGPSDLERWRRAATAEQVAAAVRLAHCRLRGASKFARAERMWLDPVGLEQATAEAVARHKAQRFSGSLVVDLCAGIGGDTLALAVESDVLAVDADRAMCRRILWNAGTYEVAGRVQAIQGRAEQFAIPAGTLVHVDPDRRSRPPARARVLRDYSPDLDFLRALPGRARGGAIKLSPASDFESLLGDPGLELELVSLAGECKEATVWFGGLATCRRRATCLPAGASWTDREGKPVGKVPSGTISDWVYDPDPALSRSGQLDSFAAAHSLARCAAGVDYLTSRTRVDSPFLAAFEVIEVIPLDVKRLRRMVAERRLGILEIKPKGLDIRPETLRGRLRLEGPEAAALLLIGGPGPARAVLARRA